MKVTIRKKVKSMDAKVTGEIEQAGIGILLFT